MIFYFTCRFYTYNLIGKVKYKGPLLRTTRSKIMQSIKCRIISRQGLFFIDRVRHVFFIKILIQDIHIELFRSK